MRKLKLNVCSRTPKLTEQPKVVPDLNKGLKELDDHDRAIARTAMKAIVAGLALEVDYNGSPRIVEVHAVGVSTAGKPCMRVYQLHGATNSGDEQGWKLMSLGKVFEMPKFMDITSLAPREGYRKGDMAMTKVFTEV